MKAGKPSEESDEALRDRLLQLIEDGDATIILSTEYTESLNELMKFEFIAIENERLQLTEKGQQAKLIGIKAMMEKNVSFHKEIELNDFPQQKVTKGISNQSFLIILLFFLVSLMAMITLVIS